MSNEKPGVDPELIRSLANILNDTNLTEIEIEQGELRIKVLRKAPAVHAVMAAPTPLPQAAMPSFLSQAALPATLQPAAPASDSKKALPYPQVRQADI